MSWNTSEKTGEDIINDIREAQKVIMEDTPFTVCTVEYCYKCRYHTIHRFGKCQIRCLLGESDGNTN